MEFSIPAVLLLIIFTGIFIIVYEFKYSLRKQKEIKRKELQNIDAEIKEEENYEKKYKNKIEKSLNQFNKMSSEIEKEFNNIN